MAATGSNSGRYTLCPYYEGEYKSRITCEDTCRHFDEEREKWSWMDMYCDTDWMKCPHAIALTEAYERLEKGDAMAVKEHETEALRKELNSMAMKLGRAKKRVDELRDVNQSFIRKNDDLEGQKKMYFDRWKEADKQLKEYERKIDDQIKRIVEVYEQRMAYLIDVYVPSKVFYEDDVEDWARDRAFAITGTNEGGRIMWEVKFEAAETDQQHDDTEGPEKE